MSSTSRLSERFRLHRPSGRRGAPILAGALSGALAALALPPFHLWPLAFVALVPLVRAVRRAPEGDGARSESVHAGLAFGVVFYGLLLHWVPWTLHGMVPAGALTGVLAIVVLAGVGGLQGAALHALFLRWTASPVVAVALVWAGSEVVLAHAGPLAFPWTPLGLSLSAVPEVAGIAEWVGPRGLTLWIAAANGGVVATLAARRAGRVHRRRVLRLAGAVLLLTALPAGWGVWRADRLPIRPLPPLFVGQMHISRDTLLEADARDRAAAAALSRMAADPPAVGDVTLAILPEAPFASVWGGEAEASFSGLAAELGVPVLVGAHWMDPAALQAGRRNALLVVDPGGAVQPLHSKLRLVPGVERPGLAPGPAGAATEVGGIVVGALICFEVAFAGEARRRRSEGAELLVNPSNDGWFRPTGILAGGANAQHRAHLVLRAVETRAGAVRSSLGGELLVIAPTGRVERSRPAGGEGLFPVRPVTSTVTSGFVRFGELGVLLLLGSLAAVGARGRLVGMDHHEGSAR